jgi:hypothetical protein
LGFRQAIQTTVESSSEQIITSEIIAPMADWIPDYSLALLNGVSGLFSASKGLTEALKPSAPIDRPIDTSNPWLYVVGGLATVGVGLLSLWSPVAGQIGTGLLVVASLYNAWFGAANKDWRFWTLNTYSAICIILIVVSYTLYGSAS